MSGKKSRKPNFSQHETAFVAEKYEQFKDILDAAQKDCDSNRRKKDARETILSQHRRRFPEVLRSVDDLRQKLSKLKTESREQVLFKKKSQKKTGGGKPVPEPSEAHKKIIDMCQDTPSFQGLPGVESTTKRQSTSGVSDAENIEETESETFSDQTGSNNVADIRLSTSSDRPKPPKIPRKASFGDLVDLEKHNLIIKQQNLLLKQEKLKLEIELLKRNLKVDVVDCDDKQYFQL